MQIIRYQIITYNTTDNTYLLSPHETPIEQRPINLIPKSNKCKVITVKRNPEGSGYILMTPMDTDLLKLPNSTSEFNYDSAPNIISNPEIIVVQQLSHDPWIDRWIEDTKIQEELNDLRLQITDFSHLTFYTDGSL